MFTLFWQKKRTDFNNPFYYLLNIANIFETVLMTSVLFCTAKPFPTALPPIVKDDIIADTKTVTIRVLISVNLVIKLTITTPVAPDTIPQTSPITSQHTDDTLLLFFIKLTPTLPPLIFLADIELNTVISPQVTATPTISKIIPKNINIKVTIIAINKETLLRINEWKNQNLEPSLKKELDSLTEDELNDAFYRELAFGTGGLRGVMGVGTNRLNVYTIKKASQGVANYVKNHFENLSICIGYDSRLNSKLFAMVAASVYAANGLKVYIYKECMPTPTLSYAVRELKTSAGVVVTASHNPKEYNGYKVYGEDGCQIGLEVANEILEEINKTNPFADVKEMDFDEGISNNMISWIGEDLIENIFNYELSFRWTYGKWGRM